MLQYHVSEGSLDKEEKNTIWKEVDMPKTWMAVFYTIIAQNNRCECYTSKQYKMVNGKCKIVRKAHIVGYPFDVECVIVMAQLVEETIKNGISKCRETARFLNSSESTKGITNSYACGFRIGLQKAFDEQNAKQEYHLMCIIPKEVKKEMDAVPNLRRKTERIHIGYSDNECRALKNGKTDGYNTGLRKQLGDA